MALTSDLLASIKVERAVIEGELRACEVAAAGAFTWRCINQCSGLEEIVRRIQWTYKLVQRIAPVQKFPLSRTLVESVQRSIDSIKYVGWEDRGLRTAYCWAAVALSDLGVVLRWCLAAAERHDAPEAFLADEDAHMRWLLATFRISVPRKGKRDDE